MLFYLHPAKENHNLPNGSSIVISPDAEPDAEDATLCAVIPFDGKMEAEEARAFAEELCDRWNRLTPGCAEKHVREAGELLTLICFSASFAAGWHNDLKTGQPFTAEQQNERFGLRIALCHSELSEALEGHRKGLMDDKLPHRRMAEVELADAVIRIFDLGGAMGYDLGGAIAEKLAYNRQRADHKLENRAAEGGKAY